MYSLRYGTLPIVRKVGGLADSVVDTNEATLVSDTATGFVFDDYSSEQLASTIERAIDTFGQTETWQKVVSTGMSRDWSWTNSAKHYVATYHKARQRRHDREKEGRS